MIGELVHGGQRPQQGLKADLAERVLLERLGRAVVVAGTRRVRLTIRVEPRQVGRDGRALVAGVARTAAVCQPARVVKPAVADVAGGTLELVAAVRVGAEPAVALGICRPRSQREPFATLARCISADSPSGLRFSASFIARIVSAICICWAAMVPRTSTRGFVCRSDGEGGYVKRNSADKSGAWSGVASEARVGRAREGRSSKVGASDHHVSWWDAVPDVQDAGRLSARRDLLAN